MYLSFRLHPGLGLAVKSVIHGFFLFILACLKDMRKCFTVKYYLRNCNLAASNGKEWNEIGIFKTLCFQKLWLVIRQFWSTITTPMAFGSGRNLTLFLRDMCHSYIRQCQEGRLITTFPVLKLIKITIIRKFLTHFSSKSLSRVEIIIFLHFYLS